MNRIVIWTNWLALCLASCHAFGDEPKPAPPANPLKNLLEKLLPPNQQPAAQPKPADPDAADEMDERAPKDRRQQDLLKKVAAAVEQQDWPAVLELLSRLTAEPEDSVVRQAPPVWGSTRAQTLRLILSLPNEFRRAFRQKFGAEAQRLLDDLGEQPSVSRLGPIAWNYLLTDAGQDAADRLGSWHLDRGEFVLATQWFRRLEESQAQRTASRSWQLKAAFAAARAGDQKLAERWRGTEGDNPDETLELGGESVRVFDWWRSRPQQIPARELLAEWPMIFGRPDRTGVPRGGEPIMSIRWQKPLTSVQSVQQQIDQLVDDLRDQQVATIPVIQPVFWDGLIALRTLSGVQVWEAASGRLLWSAGEDRPAERLLSASHIGNSVRVQVMVGQQMSWSVAGQDNSVLPHVLFGNGSLGPLSSDGRQLFFVDDDSQGGQAELPNYGVGGVRRFGIRSQRPADGNQLVSFDLRSGRPLWSVGGVAADETFQAPLAGVYFLGPPVADGNELFVIGERASEVRLYCLNRETGAALWSQLLAVAGESILKDTARRQLTAQPAIADGVIVCPTTVGWMTAVDRGSRSLLWAHRYSTPNPNNRRRGTGRNALILPNWNDRWQSNPPVIVNGSVIFAPPESDDQTWRQGSLICLGLHDGSRRWTRTREQNWVAFNGVHDGRVLLLGNRRLSALSVARGETQWEIQLNPQDGSPSGLGTVVKDRWLVPINGDQLWTVLLKDGVIVSKQPVSSGIELGNLHPYRGSVVSLHPTGASCLEQRDELLAEIGRRRVESSADVVATLLESQLLRLDGKPREAWDLLAKLPESELADEVRGRYRHAAREVLFGLIEARPQAFGAELQRLESLLDSPADRAKWERLKFTSLRFGGDWLAAFRELREISRRPDQASVQLPGVLPRAIRRDVWLNGAFADLWNEMTPEARAELEPDIASEIQAALQPGDPNANSVASDSARSQTLRRYAFHPAAAQRSWQLAEDQLAQKDFARAEFTLLALTDSSDRNRAARAWQKLVEVYRDSKLPLDANLAALRLQSLGDAEVADGVSATKWVDQELSAGRLSMTTLPALPDWGHLAFRVERHPREVRFAEMAQDCSPPNATWPFFATERVRFEQTYQPFVTQRVTMTRTDDVKSPWIQPLRSVAGSTSARVVSRAIGHQLLVSHRDVLHLFSPTDRRVVWTKPLEARSLRDTNENVAWQITQPLPTIGQLASDVIPSERERRRGALPHCSFRFIVSRGRHSLSVLDTATGESLWELHELPSDATVIATDELVAINSPRVRNIQLFRTADGAIIPLGPQVGAAMSRVHAVVGTDWLLISESSPSKANPADANQQSDPNQRVLERWNPVRHDSRWRQIVAANDHCTWIDSQTLVLVKSDGTLHSLDAESGQMLKLGSVPAGNFGQQQRHLLADRDRVFLVLGNRPNQAVNSELPSLPVNGLLVAFDRRAGGELWRKEVKNQLLVLDQFANLPVLLFSHTSWEERAGLSLPTRHVLLADKRTGRTLVEDKFAQQFGGERTLGINLTDPEITILGQERLRLIGESK